MQLPTIHLNGTSKDGLIQPLCAASAALNEAYQALKQTAPNGRDYYPQSMDALRQAEIEHNSRLRRLAEIKEEVDALTLAIAEIN